MNFLVNSPKQRGVLARHAAAAATSCLIVGTLGVGCLNRPVKAGEPVTKTNFTAKVTQTAVDKLDVLLAIDNSASMGDKQDLLRQAVPDLIKLLVSPNCIDASGKPTGQSAGLDGTCQGGGKAEFPPVHDLHIGIVSSSLGGGGSDQCDPNATNSTNSALNTHNDDKGHLLNRAGADEHAVGDASGSNFLAWFPDLPTNASHPVPAKPIKTVAALNQDFQDMVSGVHERGCGFEAQLESWYRFLIQPDPYDSIGVSSADGNRRVLVGTDATVLQQRHDFLRPDSLVAVIMLTDENDSYIDPLSIGGQAWFYENKLFPFSSTGYAPKGTTACAQNPNANECTSCAFQGVSDANCTPAYYDATQDQANVRFFHMKQRFGVDPQFPIERYVNGLKSRIVPNRDGEHPSGSANYVGTDGKGDCTNPLFAAELPTDPGADLCHLKAGPRSTDLVFFAVIGGVPWQLLLDDPTKPAASAFKSKLTDDDWTKIIGKDPIHYDFTGADPHMIESVAARQLPGLVQPGGGVSDTADPLNGHEWDTGGADLQYACTFPLPTSKDCALPQYAGACDCEGTRNGDPPLCNGKGSTTQTRGKAYPTIREFSVARKMADQGIVASLCPRTLDQASDDYGYRPAVRAIVDRLKSALANQCLPQRLIPDATSNEVPCLILMTLTDAPGDESKCNAALGQSVPDPIILQKFRDQQAVEYKAAGGPSSGPDPKTFAVCQLNQLVVPSGQTCGNDAKAGWCYVQNENGTTPAGNCSQAIVFTAAGQPAGAKISLQCIEKSGGGTADGG
jgi:hypothetical protein